MSHVAAVSGVSGERSRTRLVSPLAIVLVLLSAYGLWKFYGLMALPFAALPLSLTVGAALMWSAYAAIGIGIIVRLQRYARRPAWTIALALAWGAFGATYFAATANDAFSTIFQNRWGSDISIFTTGPVVEESAKALGVIALALVPVLRRFGTLEGLFYGVVVGAGFQVFENWVYSINEAFHTADSQWGAIGINAFLRGFLGIFTHAVWTGIAGAAIGYAFARDRDLRAQRIVVAVATFVGVVVLHGVDDLTAIETQILLNLANELLGLAILVAILLRVQRSEKQRLTDLVVANGGWGVLDVDEIARDRPGRAARKKRRLELRYAYARDQYGPEGTMTRRAEAALT